MEAFAGNPSLSTDAERWKCPHPQQFKTAMETALHLNLFGDGGALDRLCGVVHSHVLSKVRDELHAVKDAMRTSASSLLDAMNSLGDPRNLQRPSADSQERVNDGKAALRDALLMCCASAAFGWDSRKVYHSRL
jgi:hypothetical protein